MKIKSTSIALALLAFATLNSQLSTLHAQDTAFTYQGRLNTSGSPASGLYDFRFKLDADDLGDTGATGYVLTNGVPVTNGLFVVTIDFGTGIFNGSNYWLDVEVRTNNPANTLNYTMLTPLQAVTPTPYAIFANTASNVVGSVSPASLSGTYGSALTLNNAGNSFSGSYSGNGANVTNVNAATLNGLSAGNFWQLGGNNVSAGQFLGSTNNQPVELWVNGGRVLRLEPGGVSSEAAFFGFLNPNGAPNVIGGSSINFVAKGVVGATIGGGGTTNYAGFSYTNSVTADFGTVGGGGGNTASGNTTTVGGGGNNTASGTFIGYATVSGGDANKATGDYATVGGGSTNIASGIAATTGGGSNNIVSADYGTISGGSANTASGSGNTVGGGIGNHAIGVACTVCGGSGNIAFGTFATVSGGENSASGAGATVGGGGGNAALGANATVGGGEFNYATNNAATVPGGLNNIAGGVYSFAAGQQAQALHQGAFVWADSQNGPFASTANDQFCIRAQGGVQLSTNTSLDFGTQTRQMLNLWGTGFGIGVQSSTLYYRTDNGFAWYEGGTHSDGMTNSGGGTTLMTLDSNGNLITKGTLTQNSDRNLKSHFAPVSAVDVLDKVAGLPISTWTYKDDTTRHLGPMAQDFYAAFKVGPDERHITTVDEGGVALAAIQGLNQKVEEKETRIQQQATEIAELKQRLEALEKIVLNQKSN